MSWQDEKVSYCDTLSIILQGEEMKKEFGIETKQTENSLFIRFLKDEI